MLRHGTAWRILGAFAACLLAEACISIPAFEAEPSLETLRILREQAVPPVSLGEFVPELPSIGKAINIRGSTLKPPNGKDYAAFLGQTFESELRAAGNLSPTAHVKIFGVLTESHASEDMSHGHAAVGARIAVQRDGRERFAKAYRVETAWKSDFIGAIAIPDAFQAFNSLYPLLVRQVFSDPEFVAALKQ